MERKLASIRRISDLTPITGADFIELATVDGWTVIVKKGEHQVGELIIYCEIDSFLPVREEFEFLRKSSFKVMSGGSLYQEGFRIKTMKMKGVLSQGLILPLSILNTCNVNGWYKTVSKCENGVQKFTNILREDDEQPTDICLEEGTEVTSLLGIVKYEVPEVSGPGFKSGKPAGNFPYFIPKTDEDRIQNQPHLLERVQDRRFIRTEKLHGTSATYWLNENVFGVASRNWELKPDESVYWKMAIDNGIEEKMRTHAAFLLDYNHTKGANDLEHINFAIQGEIIGEGINKNYYKIDGHKIHFFSGYLIDEMRYLSPFELKILLSSLGLEQVPILEEYMQLPTTVSEILQMAKGPSVYSNQSVREGDVYRSVDSPRISFKVINNDYLLKEV